MLNIYTYGSEECANFLEKLEKRASSPSAEIIKTVTDILNDVKENGDAALLKYTEKFDGVSLTSQTLEMPREQLEKYAENLPDDLENTAGGLVMALVVQRLDHAKYVHGREARHGRLADDREHIRFQPIEDGLAVGLGIGGRADFVPLAGEELEGVAGHSLAFLLLLFLDRRRVCALVEQGFCLIAAGAGIPQRNGGIFAEAEKLGLTLEAIGHAPEFASGGSDVEEEAFAVEVLFRRGGGF